MIVSNHLLGQMPLPENITVRVNLAWVSADEARKILDNTNHNIYLDYPSGRTKPPKPTMTLEEAVELSYHPDVKYFAVSNVESVEQLEAVDTRAILVPKIETEKGVKNMREMIDYGITHMMLDKEDLYVNVGADSDKYEKLVAEARSHDVRLLELQGVVFDE